MSLSRAEYFKDLLDDCEIAVAHYPSEQKAVLIAALILSDGINGLRKALLQSRFTHIDKD